MLRAGGGAGQCGTLTLNAPLFFIPETNFRGCLDLSLPVVSAPELQTQWLWFIVADNCCCVIVSAVEFLEVCGVAAVLKFGLCSFAFDRDHGERIGLDIFKGGVCCGPPAVSQLPGNENTFEQIIFDFSSIALRNTFFCLFLAP